MARPTPAVPADLQELSGRFEGWRRTRRREIADSGAAMGGGRGTGSIARCVPDGAGAALGVQKAQAVDGRGSDPARRSDDGVLRPQRHLWNW